MGDAADHAIECEIHRQMYPFGIDVMFADPVRDKNRDTIARSTWKTKDGSKIKFKDMDLTHLLNVAKMVKRRGHQYADQLMDYYQYRATLEAGNE